MIDNVPSTFSVGTVLESVFEHFRDGSGMFFRILIAPGLFSAVSGALILRLVPGIGASEATADPLETLKALGPLMISFFVFWVSGTLVGAAALGAMVCAVEDMPRSSGAGGSAVRAWSRAGRHLPAIAGVGGIYAGMTLAGVGGSTLMGGALGGVSGLIHPLLVVISLPVIFAGLLATLVLLVRYAVAVPACVREGAGPLAAMRRSATLTRGHRMAVAVCLFVTLLVNYVVSILLQGPFLLAGWFISGNAGAPGWVVVLQTIAGGVGHAVGGAFVLIGVAVLYEELSRFAPSGAAGA